MGAAGNGIKRCNGMLERDERNRLIQEHLEAIRRLQTEAAPPVDAQSDAAATTWPPQDFYWLFHVIVGMVLGMIGAAVSLVLNVVGAPLFGKDPLQLIRIYLTFPMGQRAMELKPDSEGMVLFIGCVLYLITGGLYGILFHLLMTLKFSKAPAGKRFLVATAIGLGLWLVNFYLILSWLQPLLLGGNWIVSEVPILVAAVTHLAFAWTMLAVEFWGKFEPTAISRNKLGVQG